MKPTPTVTSGYAKRAGIREPGYPIGQPAPCFFHCPCGTKVPAYEGSQVCPQCGQGYTSDGWLFDPPCQWCQRPLVTAGEKRASVCDSCFAALDAEHQHREAAINEAQA